MLPSCLAFDVTRSAPGSADILQRKATLEAAIHKAKTAEAALLLGAILLVVIYSQLSGPQQWFLVGVGMMLYWPGQWVARKISALMRLRDWWSGNALAGIAIGVTVTTIQAWSRFPLEVVMLLVVLLLSLQILPRDARVAFRDQLHLFETATDSHLLQIRESLANPVIANYIGSLNQQQRPMIVAEYLALAKHLSRQRSEQARQRHEQDIYAAKEALNAVQHSDAQ
ncbi:hypothetical protein IC617_08445 [Neiella sp. HB171785]|uniref:Uncharacterized protein n=1 Tax=Neiella litorisoli TaxID=2771431 RepID=A0A8J6QGE4_9GAMM|nr:hypothetical protein [Neiella litorisoli]MBD1389454.1 hypothetical protein [Neiella litorisoli]